MKLIPSLDRLSDIRSRAEIRVGDLLSQVDVGENATCFYSVHLPRHEYKRMSEIDFLVVMRGFVLVIEVKGGRLARHDGTWSYIDRYGESHDSNPRGPFVQARTAMHSLRDLLQERLPGAQLVYGSMVITPDQVLDRDLEWLPAEHVGPTGMSVAGLAEAIGASARHWRNLTPIVNPTDVKPLLQLLRPDFDRVPALSVLSGSLEQDFVRLAREQYEAMSGSEVNARLLITGGAGSGKTLLAVETARRASLQGQRVLVTCRSASVVELMGRSLEGTSVTCLPFDRTEGVEAFDVLVVDEAQDLMTVGDVLRLDSLVVGGIRNGNWRMFSDPNNQARVDGQFESAVLEELKDLAALYHLPYNCRNTATVVQQTQLLIGADLGVARAGEGPQVEYVRYQTDEDAAHLLDAQLKRLRQDDVDLGTVAVISLRGDVANSSAMHTRAFRRDALTVQGGPSSGKARLVSVKDFKGLEAAHVLVVDADDLAEAVDMARLYVAMTRPRVSLWVSVGPRAWEQLKHGTASGEKR